MRLLSTSLFFLIFPLAVYAQIQQPIYRSASDSAMYSQLQERLSELMAPGGGGDPHSIDSLRERLLKLRNVAVIGVRYRYQPDGSYTPLTDLLDGKVKPADVKKLSISEWKEKKLPREIYHCTELQSLEIIDGAFRKIPRKLNRLKKLERLAVYTHKSKRPLRIARNTTIHHVLFRGDTPDVLPRSFHRFTRLDTLDLKRNGLTSFPSVHKNNLLKQLVLAENQLTLKDKKIHPNASLEHLLLQRNSIEEIPASISQFPRLKKLILNYNRINKISPELAQLSDLEELGLYQNNLTAIPSVVYGMKQLKFLDLYYNQLEVIDDDIVNLQNLEILYLSSNRIYKISEKVGELKNLKELYVHHNRLSYLPESLKKLNDLEVLRMNANNLVDVPEWIAELKNLKNLDISHNRIYRAPAVIRKLANLELVGLTENTWENKEDVMALADELATRGVIVQLEQLD